MKKKLINILVWLLGNIVFPFMLRVVLVCYWIRDKIKIIP